MTEIRKVVKVFLASPGDLPDERRAAKAVVDELNDEYAEEFGYQVELIGWEDTVTAFGRPQATINRELERCELFVGLMWKKWGTPPDTKGTYSSGFEEEFKTTVRRRLNEGRPEISLLFKEIDQEFLRDPGEDLKKVLAFKKKLIADKEIYFENFADTRELEKKIRRCITKFVRELRNRENEEISAQSQSSISNGEKRQASEKSNSALDTPLSSEGAKFLRELISNTERDAEKEPITPVEVARFRLLANIVGNHENDERSLGPHDANLLFAKGGDFTFGRRELTGLLASGLKQYSHENTPLWRWIAAIDGFTDQILPIFSLIGSSTEKKGGVLAAMKLISEPLPSDPAISRQLYLDSWFAKDMASSVKVAALAYLGDCGITSDLPTINQELDRNDYQTASTAADAIIRITLRDSREKSILSLYELQPNSISQKVLSMLFDNDEALSTKTLLNGIAHQNPEVRRIVVELLCKRYALPDETAEQLLTDNDAKVRYESLKSLVKNGRTFSYDEAKKILIKQVQTGAFGLLGAGMSDSAGETCWSHFQLHHLRSLKNKELEAIEADDLIFSPDPHFILTERLFKQRGQFLRKAIDNEFKEIFSQALRKKIKQFGENTNLIEKIRSLEIFLRKDLTRKGLDLICHKAKPCDLGRVRLALKRGFVNYSNADIEYLRRFGEWEDIPLIIDSVKRPEVGRGLTVLSAPDETKYQVSARAIYALGKTRLSEVFALEAPSRLLSQLIVETSDKTFRNLGDKSITPLFQSEGDIVRKTAAIKCVRALPKARITKLLANYISGDQSRYYNVVHWLDFGASCPRDRAILAAEKVLNKDW